MARPTTTFETETDEHESKCTSSAITNARLRKFLRIIQLIFCLQLTFNFMVPALDAFLELGEGFNSLMDNLYMNENQNQNKNHNKNSGGGGNDHNNDQLTAKKRTITTICVPGAGFSGFWYSFGRLHALEHDIGNRTSTSTLHSVKGAGGIDVKNQTNEAITVTAAAAIANYEYEYGYHNYLHGYEYDYECFSAGCLVVVATLMKYSMEEVLEKASNAQNEYIAGNIRRYDVVEHFVDSLLGIPLSDDEHEHENEHEHEVLTKEALSRIQIITTGLNYNLRNFDYDPNHAYFKYYSRSPADIRELKEYLIQTTWIPYVTGESVWRKDTVKGDYHMDGAFLLFPYKALPRCTGSSSSGRMSSSNFVGAGNGQTKRKIGLPLRFDLLWNALNPDLGRVKAMEFYDLGLRAKSGIQ